MLAQLVNQYYTEISKIAYEIDNWLYETEKDVQKVVDTVDDLVYGEDNIFSKMSDLEGTISTLFNNATKIFNRTEKTFVNIKKQKYNKQSAVPNYNSNFTTNVKTMKKYVNKDLVDIINGSSTYMEGTKKKRAWSWKERKNQLETYLQNNNVANEDIKHVKEVVKNHGYLSSKRKKIKKEVEEVLNAYES